MARSASGVGWDCLLLLRAARPTFVSKSTCRAIGLQRQAPAGVCVPGRCVGPEPRPASALALDSRGVALAASGTGWQW